MVAQQNDIRDWVIYKITSPSGRNYIGKTVDYVARRRNYKTNHCKAQRALYASLLKYGFENHTIAPLDFFKGGNSCAADKEMFWIRSYMCNKNKYPEQNGLNLTDGGDGTAGHKMSDENKRKLSEMHKSGGRRTNKGMKHTEETKQKLRKPRVWRESSYIGAQKAHLPEDVRRETYGKHNIGHTRNRGRKLKTPNWAKGLTNRWSEEQKRANAQKHIGNTYRRGKKVGEIGIKNMIESKTVTHGKPFQKISLDNVLIKEWRSISEASRELGIGVTKLRLNAIGKFKTIKDCIFKYK